jgi:hypothetical protein
MCNFRRFFVISILLGQNISLISLFWNIANPCTFLRVETDFTW